MYIHKNVYFHRLFIKLPIGVGANPAKQNEKRKRRGMGRARIEKCIR